MAKVEWHRGELYPRVGFIVINMTRPEERIVAFYNQRGTAKRWIKDGKDALKWTRSSCCSFAANAARLQLHALAYNLANFMRTLALPEAVKQWSLTSVREKLVKIGAKVVRHGSYVVFQMAEGDDGKASSTTQPAWSFRGTPPSAIVHAFPEFIWQYRLKAGSRCGRGATAVDQANGPSLGFLP